MSKRRLLVTVILVGLFAALGALVSMRDHGALPTATADASAKLGDAADTTAAKGKVAKAADPDNAGKGVDGKAATPQPDGDEKPPAFDRTVRTVGLGWDLLVPGHLASTAAEKGETTVFEDRRLAVAFKAVDGVEAIKDALARGGADAKGADIAILPLPEMVAAYEDLRALEPHIFFVVGWSRGRDALYAKDAKSLLKPPRGKISVMGQGGTSATLLAVYLLDLAGVPASRLRLTDSADKVKFAALNRASDDGEDAPEGTRVIVTSADAPSLIPFVAIAPRGFLDNHNAVAAWVSGWLGGVDILKKDVPDAARRISAMNGSPEAVALVKQLGQVQFSGLTDNVRRAGLSGRDAVTLEELFAQTWRLWKELGVISTPSPRRAPLAPEAITSLILSRPDSKATGANAKHSFDTDILLRVSIDARDASALRSLGLVAGVFSGSAVRLGSQRNKRKTAAVLEDLTSRFDLAPGRFELDYKLSKKRTIVLEILKAP